MPLRTTRRRISPRTKHRYRTIREFFRRALGRSSQQSIEINSSIALNVTDLQQKIQGLEQQLNQVSKHCHEIVCIESSTHQGSESVTPHAKRETATIKKRAEEFSHRKSNEGLDTKVIYKTSESHYRKSDESDYVSKSYKDANNVHGNNMSNKYFEPHVKKKSKSGGRLNDYVCNPNLRKYQTQSVCQNFNSACSTSSFHSMGGRRETQYPNAGYSGYHPNKKKNKYDHEPKAFHQQKDNMYIEQTKRNAFESVNRNCENKHPRNRKDKMKLNNLNEDFIADIIKRQYKPVKMFGRRESDLSQFSAPMCRDHEFSIRENIQEGPELCSCCYDDRNHRRRTRYDDLSDMRSICDTRLYSSNRNSRLKNRRRHIDVYNDSEFYDLIPVKEKSSPKSRRKFVEDNMMSRNFYREVPPSPRSHRPRLNLKAQYYSESDGHMDFVRHPSRRPSPSRSKRHEECIENVESDNSLAMSLNRQQRHRKGRKFQNHLDQGQNKEQLQHDTGTMSSLQYSTFVNEQANVTTDTLNKSHETDSSVDKTDKALSEIKDILQCFLHEIKKESTASQFDKSDLTTKMTEKSVNDIHQNNAKVNANVMPNNGSSFNNFSVPQCGMPPYMPAYPNPCCYPIIPMCPMNCIQNGYVVPSPSYTCATCANNSKEDHNTINVKNPNSAVNENCNTETDELIKEIYKFVSQSPTGIRKATGYNNNSPRKDNCAETKIQTSRSIGGTSKVSKHDANVGTPKIKCYSRSCEAIGSRMISDTYYSGTNGTYSETVLEKLSLEATGTESVSETEFSTEYSVKEKAKDNKFSKVLKSFGLLKKNKKKDVIQELSESESAVEVNVKNKPPFRQEITNYSMHGQEYYQRPPVPDNPYQPRAPEYPNDPRRYHLPYNPGNPDYPIPPINDIYNPQRVHQTIHEHRASYYHPRERPTAPPYTGSYENYNHQMPPQVPLCLKEIEVKSTGTQSERKMSFFRKVRNKMQVPEEGTVPSDPQKNCSTQTKVNKPGLFNWKNLQEKPMQKGQMDPMAFSFKTQNKLAEGDMTMRNAMLKKLFYKRNPFSPRNLIVRTLLGKDKSSYGAPPNIYKPRMFF